MGFLKKASKALFGSSGVPYSMAAALDQRQNTTSDLGNIKWNGNTRTFESSANDQVRNNLISQGLGTVQQGLNSYSLDPTEASQAYYDQATRLLNDQFGRQRQSADTALPRPCRRRLSGRGSGWRNIGR